MFQKILDQTEEMEGIASEPPKKNPQVNKDYHKDRKDDPSTLEKPSSMQNSTQNSEESLVKDFDIPNLKPNIPNPMISEPILSSPSDISASLTLLSDAVTKPELSKTSSESFNLKNNSTTEIVIVMI